MVNKGDFIKLEYKGHDDKGNIFDATDGEIAEKLHNKKGPLLIVFGYDRLVPGLEEALLNMKKGDSKEVVLTWDKAFGERSKDLIRVISENELLKNNIRPEIGLSLQLETDQGPLVGIIKSVNSGRVTMDFNHPLAGKGVRYDIKLVDLISDKETKVSALLEDMQLNGKAKFNANILELELEKPKTKEDNYEMKKQYCQELIKSLISEIKEVHVKEI